METMLARHVLGASTAVNKPDQIIDPARYQAK
jgi:hypothetical protein